MGSYRRLFSRGEDAFHRGALARVIGLLSDNADRGAMRLRRAGMSGITSVMAQATAMAANLITVPLTVRYLGPERYGVWLTLCSAVAWLSVMDLGFGGNALINVLAEADGKADRDSEQGLVATSFWTLVMIAAIVGLIFSAAFPFISWAAVFNVTSLPVVKELRQALILQTAVFLLLFPLGVVNATYRAFQEGYIANCWELIASVSSMIAVCIVTRWHGGLPQLILALSGSRVLIGAANAVYLFSYRRPWLAPLPRLIRKRYIGRLSGLGAKYLANQLAVIATFQSQPMIITHVLSPASVGIFVVAQRIVTLPSTIVYMFNYPLLSAYSEAKARGDWPWIWKTVRTYLFGALAFTLILEVIICFVATSIIRVWAGPALVPSIGLVIAFAAYTIIATISTSPGILLYGLEEVGGLAIVQTVHAILCVVLCVRLAQPFHLVGVAAGMSISCVVANWLGQGIQIRRILKRNRIVDSRQPVAAI